MPDAVPSPTRQPAAAPPSDLTIEALASQAGMTVRNVRAYNSAGLLSPPALRGRLGLYGAQHVAQLQLIRALREQGISLERIKTLVRPGDGDAAAPRTAWGDSWQRLGQLAQALARHIPQPPGGRTQAQADWQAQWRQALTPALAQTMQRSGLQRLRPDGAVEHLSDGMRPLGARLAHHGVALQQVLEVQAVLSQQLRLALRQVLPVVLEALARHQTDGAQPERARQEKQQALLQDMPDLLMQAVQGMLPLLLQQEMQRLTEVAAPLTAAAPSATAPPLGL